MNLLNNLSLGSFIIMIILITNPTHCTDFDKASDGLGA